jgi:hypothetical protein
VVVSLLPVLVEFLRGRRGQTASRA